MDRQTGQWNDASPTLAGAQVECFLVEKWTMEPECKNLTSITRRVNVRSCVVEEVACNIPSVTATTSWTLEM